MKVFDDLSERQQEAARRRHLRWLVQGFCDGAMSFHDKTMQAHVQAAAEKAEAMKTPWFMHEYLLESPAGDMLRRTAAREVMNFIYLEPGEVAMPEPEEPND